jgi:class 3 adenylate cyclase/tetratricopeptide (TPR) repeat protein
MTVMFCDLVGSTEMSNRMDEEELRDVLHQYHALGERIVASYGGHIAQFLGDGLLVYFGYPAAHEDDAERAVRAGLDLLLGLEDSAKAGGPKLDARIGVHTGPVVVGDVGGVHRREVLAQGGTVNLAARLQSTAQPGTLVISGDTLKLVTGIFLTEDLGPQSLKGVAGPVVAYRVDMPTGVRSRLDIAGGRLTPLVGRDLEVGLLLDRWEHVQEGEGQVVLISGEAGVGKSRLALALRDRVKDQPHTWLECRCSPYTQNSPFHPVIELVNQGLMLLPQDSDADKLGKLERGLELSGFNLDESVPVFAALLNLPLGDKYAPLEISPELLRSKTLEGFVRWCLALGNFQPLVLVVEDLHWNDPSSLELLGNLIEQSPTAKVLLVGTARPEFTSPWGQRSNLTPIQLTHFGKRQARELVQKMSPDLRFPDDVLDAILERAGGVPLYVEELTRMVMDSGMLRAEDGRYVLKGALADLAIPDTLHDSLAARLDRLSSAKEVAQTAAALGREFPYALLAAVAGMDEPKLRQGLDRLTQAELLYQRGTPPEAVYTFKHALIQDAAYESMLKSTRRALHAKIAQTLAERFPERVQSQPEIAAKHLELAGRTLDAVTNFHRAAELAGQRHANLEAVAHLNHALTLLRAMPDHETFGELELNLCLLLGQASIRARGYAHPETAEAFETAARLCDTVGNPDMKAMALTGLAAYLVSAGESFRGAEAARRVVEIGDTLHNDLYLVLGHVQAGYAEFFKGNNERALEHAEAALRSYSFDAHGQIGLTFSVDQGVAAHGFANSSLFFLGYREKALHHLEQMERLSERINHPHTSAFTLNWRAQSYVDAEDFATVREAAEACVALGQRYGFPLWLGVGKIFSGWARALGQGDEQAIDQIEEGLAIVEQTGMGTTMVFNYFLLAQASAFFRRFEDAHAVLDVAEGHLDKTRMHFGRPQLYRERGILLVADGGDEQLAENLLRKSIETARAQKAKTSECQAALELARLWQRQGKTKEARELLQPIYTWFTEGHDMPYLVRAKALLAELSA